MSILAAGDLGLVSFQEKQLSVPVQNLAMQVKLLQFPSIFQSVGLKVLVVGFMCQVSSVGFIYSSYDATSQLPFSCDRGRGKMCGKDVVALARVCGASWLRHEAVMHICWHYFDQKGALSCR